MSAKAELHLFDQEFTILYFNSGLHTPTDYRGQPWGTPDGGVISVVIPTPRKPQEFLESMQSDRMIRGKIRFHKWDGIHIDAELEFANAYIIERETSFYSQGTDNYTMRVVISPGIQRYRGVTFEKSWNPSDPFIEDTTPVMMREENVEPELIDSYYQDKNGNRIPENRLKAGSEIYYVIKSSSAIGKEASIDLNNNKLDFEYNGSVLEDDILTINVTSDTMKLSLKAIKQQKK
ncbi:type VI secretion system tube protein TssD [Aquimarina pacifica]|uniref:type VI secretion system tube protein TssD n=1 Tax=Aquimarina pacifica TaxID=1296415 RepID=UPI0004729662|nr:type VI secretion system tube protein TssD [Aquimarina pacifica]